MTEDEKKEWQSKWDAHACGIKCLQEIQRRNNQTVWDDLKIYETFLPKYDDWKQMPGVTGRERLREIADAMGISAKSGYTGDPSVLRTILKNSKSGGIVGMAFKFERGPDDLIGHAFLIDGTDPKGEFHTWGAGRNEPTSWETMEGWETSALVLHD
jgi:hypothetical protein